MSLCVIFSLDVVENIKYITTLLLAVEAILMSIYMSVLGVYSSYRLQGEKHGIVNAIKYLCYYITIVQVLITIFAFLSLLCNLTALPLYFVGVGILFLVILFPAVYLSYSLR